MNRNIILIALLCLLSIGRTVAQSVTVEAKICLLYTSDAADE